VPNAAPSAAASGFASLLAALAVPTTQKTDRDADWTQDDPTDGSANLSYERALRANARYKRIEWPAALVEEAEIANMARVDRNQHRAGADSGLDNAGSEGRKTASPERALKTASITIRLSHAECEQLKKRAAEAGLSTSAYLRSCTFEAEALRAQVKEALSELRGAALKGNRPAEFLPTAQAPHRWWRLWQHPGARGTQA
jgi:predicted DNA binding CopG/RHH family protein